jgi:hypothetical protein
MINKKFLRRSCSVIALLAITAAPCVNSFARDEGRDRDRGHERDAGRGGHREVVIVNHSRYSYHDGRFYRPGLFGFEFVLGIPPVGAIVTALPAGHRTIIVAGASYYYYENIYYRPCPTGYVVVSAPAPVPTPAPVVYAPAANVQFQAPVQERVTVNVPNSNGSYTPVTLTRRENGYVGPQGEFYPQNPTVEQLRALYGR